MTEPQALEGTWEEIKLHDAELSGRYVRVTVFPRKPETIQNGHGKQLQRGLFPQLRDLTEEDFKIAEWRGDDLDL